MISDAVWTEALRHAYALSTHGWLDASVRLALAVLVLGFVAAGWRWVRAALRAAMRNATVDSGTAIRADDRPTPVVPTAARRAAAG